MVRFLGFFGILLLSACSSSNFGGMTEVDPSKLSATGFPVSMTPVQKGDSSGSQTREAGTTQSKVDESYVIQPGDTLSVKFFFNPELNEEDVIVRPDGRISLQLIHEVKAANLTAPQLTALLAEKYKGQLKNPEIAVIVRTVRDPYRIYVDGQVAHPGEFEIVGSLSVLQAIARAGGLKEDTAKSSEVKVIRRGPDGKPFVININLNEVLKGRDLSQDISLHPYDILYVPRSFW
jgi:polysaccharide biosynthesis/export protein